ncbi:MAG: S8 family serine peptidase, partial [Quisquiliibacterium sp.]
APQVAAAAALIWAYSPGLTAGQVAEILKKSATDLGSPGIDSIFGAGALNIEKALAPIGAIVAPVEEESDPDDEESSNGSTDPDAAEPDESGNADDGDSSKSSSGNGAGAGLALAALVVGGVGYALVRNNPDLGETLVLDEYGRTYELDLETRIGVRNSGPSAKSVLQELDADQVQETLIQRSDLTLTATYTMDASTQPFSGSPEASSSEIDRPVGVGFRASESDGTQYAFGINQSISSFASDPLGGGTTTSLTGAFQSDAFATPFFGYTNLGYHGAVAIAPDVGWQAGLAFAAVDDQTRHGVKSDASSLQFGFRDKRYGLSVQLGLLEEDGNLLGGASDGALSVSRAQTLFSTARGNFNLNGNWSIVGQYSHGMTWAEDQATSLVRDFSQIESNSWGLGLLGRNLSRSGDAFGIAVSQPLRTINGDARVSTPYWNRKTGGIDFKNRRTSLIPDGTETSIEFFYRRPVGKQIRLISYFVYREQPLHQAKSKSEMSLIGAVSWDFGVR